MCKFLDSWLGKNWWSLLVCVNLFLIVFTIAHPYLSNFPQKWRFVTPFSLHTENNFAAWWSGITLLLAALLAYQRTLTDSNKNVLTWYILAMVLAGLSLDEIGSFHERIGIVKGWSGILPFGILLLCLLAYTNIKLFYSEQTVINAKYLSIAIALFLSVALQEHLEHNHAWKPWMIGLRVGIEEGTELLATFFVLLAVIYQKGIRLSLLSLLPQSRGFTNLRWVAITGLVAHIIGSYLFVKFGDPFTRGNPMNWYPVAIYSCISLIFLNKVINSNIQIERKIWTLLSVLTMTTSVAISTNLFLILLPRIDVFINPEIISKHFLLIYIMQLVVFTIFLIRKLQITPTSIMVSMLSIIALIWFDLNLDSTWLRYTMLGAFSCWSFYVFTSKSLLAGET